MGSRLENLIRTAVQTFSNIAVSGSSSFLGRLSYSVNNIRPEEDLGLRRSVGQPDVSRTNPGFVLLNKVAPVTYMEIFENNIVTVSVFILKQGSRY